MPDTEQITILFWNILKRPLKTRISRIVSHYNVDILIVAECRLQEAELKGHLSGLVEAQAISSLRKLRFFFNPATCTIQEHFESLLGDLSVRRATLHSTVEILLAGVHLPSKLSLGDSVDAQYATEIAEAIRESEQRAAHTRTVVIGDFNMNPHDAGLVGIKGFCTVIDKSHVRSYKFRKRDYEAFYNPMWGLLGDRTAGPPGTYAYGLSGQSNSWHTIDQVILRSPLIPSIIDVQIVHSDGIDSLLTSTGIPDQSTGSDHLPVLLTLDTNRIETNGEVLEP